MWSLYTSLDIGRKALSAQQAALQVVSNNISNINTPGYHRETAIFNATPPEMSPAGPVGTGVQVGSVESARDRFLESRISQANQGTAREQTIVDYLGQVEATFNTSDTGIQAGISNFFNSFSNLASDPTSSPLRYGVVASAQSLTAMFRSASQQLEDTRNNANSAVQDAVGAINGLTSSIASLNNQIVAAEIGGANANTLRDQRSQALEQLSSLLDIQSYEADDGSVSISTGAGQPLVTAAFSAPLSAAAAPPNGFYEVHAGATDITASIQGGKLGGLLEVRDRLVPAYQQDLDTLAQSIITQVNTVQQAGTDLKVPPSAPPVDFFNPVASVGGAAKAFSVNSAIASDVTLLAAGQSGSPGDNSNALAFADLANQKVLAGGTQDFAGAFAALQFKVGTDQQSATNQLATQNALLTQLSNARDSYSGVSLDEEAVNLIRFQRAFQAASKFISIIDQLTEEIINTFGA